MDNKMRLFVAAAAVVALAACDSKALEGKAHEWARGMYPAAKDVRASCVGYDSDGDGYVSCAVVIDERDPVALECSWFLNSCRMLKAPMRR